MTRRYPALDYGLLLMAFAGSATAAGPGDLDPWLRNNWQAIEVVVFERLGIRDTPGEEPPALESGERELPAILWSPETSKPASGFDVATQAAVDSFQLGTAKDLPEFSGYTPPLPPQHDESREDDTAAAVQPVPATPAPAVPVPPPPPPTPEEIFRAALAGFEAGLAATALVAAPPASHQLRAAAARLVSQDNSRILWHQRWNQPFGRGVASPPAYVQAGYPIRHLASLEGVLRLSGSGDPKAAIRMHARFWLHGPFPAQQPSPMPVKVTGESPAVTSSPDPFDSWYGITESRSITPGEVHYLDHPRFGVLVSVKPVEMPADLLAAFDAMQAAAADHAGPAALPVKRSDTGTDQ